MQLDKVIFGLTTQSSSSSSSDSSSEDEEEPPETLPVQKRNEKNKDKKEIIPIKSETKIEIDIEELEIKDEEKECSEEEPVKRKRGRPLSLEKKSSPPKRAVKKALIVKKPPTPEVIVEKRGRGRPRKVVESVNTENTPTKSQKIKVKNVKENSSVSEGIKTSKNTSSSKTKSPTKESEIDENITSTTERLKDPDVVEDETVSSSCQDLVRSVKVQTKPISKKPPKSYISKVSFVN